MTRCKLVALKFLSTLSYVALTSEGLMRRTAHTCDLKLGTHYSQCLINQTSYHGIRMLPYHLVSFTKPITTAQTLPLYSHLAVLFFSSYLVFETFIPPKIIEIILSYFSNALSFEQGKRSFQISGKLSSFAKMTNKKIARHFEEHRCVT